MSNVQESLLSLDDVSQNLLFRTARTASKFTNAPVSDEQLHAIYDLVQWAPTSANTQPLRLLVVRSAEAKARLNPYIFEGNQAKVASAPATVILAAARTVSARPRHRAV